RIAGCFWSTDPGAHQKDKRNCDAESTGRRGLSYHHFVFKAVCDADYIAILIAWPLAYWLTTRWLEQYAYRIGQSAGYYLLVGAIVCSISFLLIGLQCLKVAVTNPVNSLKNE